MRGRSFTNSVGLPLLAAALAACGADPHVRPAACDFVTHGVCVASQGPRYDDQHVERALVDALAYWGAQPDALTGWAISYTPGPLSCNGAAASGCTWWGDNRTMQLLVLDASCPETAQLVHEVGHALHGDPGHQGPWWNWKAEQDATYTIVRSPGASPGCAASRYYTQAP